MFQTVKRFVDSFRLPAPENVTRAPARHRHPVPGSSWWGSLTSRWQMSTVYERQDVKSHEPTLTLAQARNIDLLKRLTSGRRETRLHVPRSVCLAKTRLRSLPESTHVEGDLDLRGCGRLRHLGRDLTVDGSLLIGGKCPGRPWVNQIDPSFQVRPCEGARPPIDTLPKRLTVGRDLTLRNCDAILSLPTSLSLGGSLTIESCRGLVRLPRGLHVPGDLVLRGCRSLRELPEGLSVGGSLSLFGAAIRELPESLSIGKHLRIECCKLNELPKGLSVPGSLNVRATPIRTLPDGMEVGRTVHLERCHELTTLPNDLKFGDDLILRRCPRLRELSDPLVVGGRLQLVDCDSLEDLPSKTAIGVERSLSNWQARLTVRGCEKLRTLPYWLKVNGAIDITDSEIKRLPKSLRSITILWRGVSVPPDLVFAPEKLTPRTVFQERNAEIRRLMVERVGCAKLLRAADARVIDEDTDPGGRRTLYEVTIGQFRSATHQRYLHCFCPSTHRDYLLGVPRSCDTCHRAAAWLAGFDSPEDYRPIQET